MENMHYIYLHGLGILRKAGINLNTEQVEQFREEFDKIYSIILPDFLKMDGVELLVVTTAAYSEVVKDQDKVEYFADKVCSNGPLSNFLKDEKLGSIERILDARKN